ncbi:MAG: NADH-quinone oxidoreductase subunit C [Candidatus Sericytochromatia bacterium]|nr:NADH-quinone oxidoreductase subunit C [Candidatus Tanganyikabacteria bacterium]
MSDEDKKATPEAGTEAGPTRDAPTGDAPTGDAGPITEAGSTKEATVAAAPAPAPAVPKAPAKPAAPPLELSPAGKALADAVAGLGFDLGEARPDSWGNPTFEVAPDRLVDLGTALKAKLGLSYLACLAPLDWPDRWEVAYHLYDFERKTWLALKTRIPKDQVQIPSVTPLWPAANWYEREGYDMYGVEFAGHPHLARLLMSDDWQTFPLRKDHPMDLEGGY